MGLIIPRVPTGAAEKTDFDSNIAVLTPVSEPVTNGADAFLLNRSDFPQRELPQVNGIRESRYQTVFRQSVLDQIHAHGKSSMEAEVCGVLIGDVYCDRLACWAYIEHCIEGNNAVGKQTQVTITSDTWSRIHETLESKYPGKKIIGWYHTHPGFGIFLSGMDLFIQDNFFNQPWQIATVYDPHSEDEGTFIWRGGKSVRETVLVENDVGPAIQQVDAGKAVEALTRRVKHLERRLDILITGILFLVLIALAAPLIVFALAPDTIKKLPLFHQPSPPSLTTPGGTTPATPASPASTVPAGANASPKPARLQGDPAEAEPMAQRNSDIKEDTRELSNSISNARDTTMTQDKVSIDWNDLKTRKVENRLREQGAMERNREYAQMAEDALPEATPPSSSLFNNAIFCMTLFGLMGGLLAWGAGVLIAGPLTPTIGAMFHYIPGAQADSAARFTSIDQIEQKLATGIYDKAQAKTAIDEIRDDGHANPYFRIAIDPNLSDIKRRVMVADLQANDNYAIFLINLMSYGLCGMMIAMCLAMAEPVTQHKVKSAWVNAGTGAAVGLLGGVAAAFLTTRLASAAATITAGQAPWLQKLSSQSLMWGMLGLFLGMGSGVVLRNLKKLFVGSVGGLCGGWIGGALFDPMDKLCAGAQIGQLVAFIAIGVVAGLATGLLENAVKAGWLKVTTGIIAGKQFILYRNPTYIGASPDCQIYLFKDAQVGKRHAAIHLLQNGIEIEDLPLGSETLVNGKPVKRAKLKNGDTIQIGATSFRFQQKRPTAGA